ncbi:MAG: carboxypeptidase regulatory-like domain-containing protein [Planctomycetes bacterium]|nr:carboxypeptidase regulatory-like domain-containing protein [Planctomycetota bacterium]MCH9726389.1 carboxypeptidase regulatory-like domain-containing protein [Planctomycetota bacterium]MCH9790165.1 carboxypeptidase regulatory-like domain-containing protein [Planctomycetota bacterium]MDF1742975.1 carboxypeptidase regulatory-like domain-containing protein [Gimesia sp.]
MNGKRSFTLKFLLVTLTGCCIGCSGGSDIDLGQVKGVVSMDGQPLPDVVVVFKPEKGNPSSGVTDANGNYELVYIGKSKGAIIGSHKVSVTTKDTTSAASTTDGDADLSKVDLTDTQNVELKPADENDKSRPKSKKSKEKIPAKYNTKTELKGDVVAGENVINFDLKSK